MAIAYSIDRSLRERRQITRQLDYLKRDNLTTEQMERIGRRLQKSGRRALRPLVRKLWKEKSGTAIYRYTCMLDFFDDSNWLDQLVQITLKRDDLDEDARLALLDALQDYGIDITAPPFARMTGYGANSMEGFVSDCLNDGERGQGRFMDLFLDAEDDVRKRMIHRLARADDPAAVAMLDVLLLFDSPWVVHEAIATLGRTKCGYALPVLGKAARISNGQFAESAARSIRRLSFMGVNCPQEPLGLFGTQPRFYHVQAGPIDIYGSRSLLFAWQMPDQGFAALILLLSESDGVVNALSYRMKDVAEYESVLDEVTAGELLDPVSPEYGLALLRDAIHHSREKAFFLPPDLYVDMRLFEPESVTPEDYLPRFGSDYLDGVVERIPDSIAASSELLDTPCLEGWLFSEPSVYDVAERLTGLEGSDFRTIMAQETERLCVELYVPRRADIVRRLLLTADFMQQIGSDEVLIQQTIATALSLVGGYVPDTHHPFIRRLILDSIEAARQALAEGFDLRLEEGHYDQEF